MGMLQKVKKLPLIIGAFLLMTWGASKKMIFQIDPTLCIEHTAKPYPSYLDQLDKLTCLTDTNWEQFYRTARPILPEIISDEELEFVFHFLQTAPQAHFDERTTQKDKLEVLLIFSSIINPE